MACDVQFGKFGYWSVQCSSFDDLMRRAGKNAQDKAVMDLLGFAKVCGGLNVYRYPDGVRRGLVSALSMAAQQLLEELNATPNVPEATIESIQRLIALTDETLKETGSNL